MGFESIEPRALQEMNKRQNLTLGVEAYPRLVAAARRRGILVVGEMVVGFDADDTAGLARCAQFLERAGFDLLRLQILQPLPGTRLFERLQREERLWLRDFPADWQKLADSFTMGVQFRPAQLQPEALQAWVKRTGMDFYRRRRIARRSLRILLRSRSPRLAATAALMSFKSRKTYVNA